ncbi:MAG TPA: DUF2339 domain-containing protein [Myxococcales bacterium]|nr:DUF2339 domain-containing protein [Myxococcales bacterium]
MQANPTKVDLRVLWITGTLLFGLSMVFLWRDLEVPISALAAVMAVGIAGVSMSRVDRQMPLVAPILMVLLVIGVGGWYAMERDPILLAPLGVCLAASLGMVAREPRDARTPEEQVRRVAVWYGMVLAALAASWATYFQLVTLRFPGDEARRLLLTAAWMVVGVALVVGARWRDRPAARDAGFAFLAAGVGKLVLYDTSHLFGMVRIAELAGAGAVLLAAALLAGRVGMRAEARS